MEIRPMNQFLASGITVLVTLTVTFLFNYFVGLPSKIKKEKQAEKAAQDALVKKNEEQDRKIAELKAAIDDLSTSRAQNLQIQAQLQATDKAILDACNEIKASVLDNQKILNNRLDRLEKREKNSLRAKILMEYRLFTDPARNPLGAWSEMEHHAFFELVKDYEELGGNDYVHSEVLPAVNRLRVVLMTDLTALTELMQSRRN